MGPRMGVGIATVGRAGVLAETIAELRHQTHKPGQLIVCGAEAGDVAGIDRHHATVIMGPRGLTAQRNAVLAAADCDVLVFFDDDFLPSPGYLAEMVQVFAADPGIVAATGHVVADGIKGPGLTASEGRTLLQADPGWNRREELSDVYNAYGCNMALRLTTLRTHGLAFDERLPLYG